MSQSLANQTVLAIESALADERSAAINEIIQLIQQLASKAFTISIEDLSELVSRDPTITEKVISCANTLGYNPTGKPVTTVSDAIHTVGFEKIRNLAISLMLAEKAGTLVNTYEQREAAALCACSGMLARELYNSPTDESRNEFLFVCASLRGYGMLLLSTFLIDDYRLAKAHALELPEDEAFQKVFGLTPLSLARRILKNTNLPQSILQSLRPITAEALSTSPTHPDQEALVIADLSLELSTTLLDESIKPDRLNAALLELAGKFSKSFPLSLERINDTIIAVEAKIDALNRAVRLDPRVSPASSKLRARINGRPLPEAPAYAKILPLIKKKKLAEMTPEERHTFSDASFSPAFETVRTCKKSKVKIDLDPVLESVAQAFAQAVDLENCFFFTRDPFDQNCFSASHGVGKLFSKVKNRPYVAPAKKDIFSICLVRQEVILIQDITAGKVGSVVPDWIHQAGTISSFIMIPISVARNLQAILVGTVSGVRKIDLSETDIKHLRSIRSELTLLYESTLERSISRS